MPVGKCGHCQTDSGKTDKKLKEQRKLLRSVKNDARAILELRKSVNDGLEHFKIAVSERNAARLERYEALAALSKAASEADYLRAVAARGWVAENEALKRSVTAERDRRAQAEHAADQLRAEIQQVRTEWGDCLAKLDSLLNAVEKS